MIFGSSPPIPAGSQIQARPAVSQMTQSANPDVSQMSKLEESNSADPDVSQMSKLKRARPISQADFDRDVRDQTAPDQIVPNQTVLDQNVGLLPDQNVRHQTVPDQNVRQTEVGVEFTDFADSQETICGGCGVAMSKHAEVPLGHVMCWPADLGLGLGSGFITDRNDLQWSGRGFECGETLADGVGVQCEPLP